MITLEKRPFKSIVYANAIGVTRPQSTQRNPNGVERIPLKRDFKQLAYVNGERQSDWITTRCYNAAGRQIWDGDHGSTVYGLAVDESGTVYQCGANSGINLEPSLFDELFPAVTAMYPGGQPKWSVSRSSTIQAAGIAVTTDGYVYFSYHRGPLTLDSRLQKLSATNGEFVLSLPVDNFYWTQVGQGWLRIKVDAANNVYAYGRQGRLVKWVNDVEYWNQPGAGTTDYRYTGFGVSNDGIVYTSSGPELGADVPPTFFIYDSNVSNVPLSTGTYLARKLRPVFPDPDWIEWQTQTYQGVGVSPSGRAISYNTLNAAIEEIAASEDPEAPTVTNRVSPTSLTSSFLFLEHAIAINDDGVFCHGTNRLFTTPTTSHEIRAADNSLIGSYDHGGFINDCIVLPNGKVIVAGERVRRSEFP